jgi:hypothetical protein
MLQGPVDGGAVSGLRLHAEDRVRAKQFGQYRAAAIPAAGIHPDDAVHGVCLLAHRLDEARQQPSTVVDYHHRSDHVPEVRYVL